MQKSPVLPKTHQEEIEERTIRPKKKKYSHPSKTGWKFANNYKPTLTPKRIEAWLGTMGDHEVINARHICFSVPVDGDPDLQAIDVFPSPKAVSKRVTISIQEALALIKGEVSIREVLDGVRLEQERKYDYMKKLEETLKENRKREAARMKSRV